MNVATTARDLERAGPRGTGGTAPGTRHALVVDDDRAERIRLQCLLERLGFDVAVADDGVAALRMLAGGFRPGVIVSDWQMPRMDGLDLCRRVRRLSGSRNAYFILVTARACPTSIEEGLEAGADDFISKPYRAEELRARVKAGRREIDRRVAFQTRNDRLMHRLADRNAAELLLRSELEAAARLQRRQLPPRVGRVGDIEVGHFAASAGLLAGDAFGWIELPGGTLAFYLLDVVGHGVSAALNSFALARALKSPRALQDLCRDDGRPRAPGEVVGMLNDRYPGGDECDQYFTMVYGTLETDTGRGVLCQAGHPHPVVVGADRGPTEIGCGGYPVGMLPDVRFDDAEFFLEPGERLVLYSDGVPDALDGRGQPFGRERLMALLAATGDRDLGASIDRIEATLTAWRAGAGWEDDASLMVVARPPVEAGQ